MTLLAVLLGLSGNDVRSSVMVGISSESIGSCDGGNVMRNDLLGDFLLFEEGGGSGSLLSGVGLEDGGLDGVLNGDGSGVSEGGAVSERMGVRVAKDLTLLAGLGGGGGFGLIEFLEENLLGLNNLGGILDGLGGFTSENGSLQVGSGSNGEIVGDDFEAFVTSGVGNLHQLALCCAKMQLKSVLGYNSISE